MICKNCGLDIDKRARFCLNCRQPLQNWFIRHKISTVMLSVFLFFCFTTMLGRVVGASNNSPTSINLKYFSASEPVQSNDTIVNIFRIERLGEISNDPADPGQEYVVISVSIKNVGELNIDYNPLYFQMQNSEGQINHGFLCVSDYPILQFGELVPGGRVLGNVVFQEPKDAKNLILIYKPTTWGEGQAIRFKL